MARELVVKPKAGRRFDLVALGEIMLRLDPGDLRIATARTTLAHPRAAAMSAPSDQPTAPTLATPHSR